MINFVTLAFAAVVLDIDMDVVYAYKMRPQRVCPAAGWFVGRSVGPSVMLFS